MLDIVPTEIALRIVREAAQNDRATGIALAQSCRLVYNFVTPILFRRVAMSDFNIVRVESVLQRPDLASLIIELTLMASSNIWKPSKNHLVHLSQLKTLRCTSNLANFALSDLPLPARSSLVKLSLPMLRLSPMEIPPTVSHLCLLPIIGPNREAQLDAVVQMVIGASSVTHLACELIVGPWAGIKPDHLVKSLCDLFEATGDRLKTVSIRFYGQPIVGSRWRALIDALRLAGGDSNRAGRWNHQIRLWRDERYFINLIDGSKFVFDDTLNGVDVWSEARPLAELM